MLPLEPGSRQDSTVLTVSAVRSVWESKEQDLMRKAEKVRKVLVSDALEVHLFAISGIMIAPASPGHANVVS